MKGPARARNAVGLGAVLALAVLAAARADRGPEAHRATLYVFGTLVEVEIRGADAPEARAATAELERLFARLHVDWHAWRPGELESLNAAIAAGRSLAVDPRLAATLRAGRRLSCESGGLFDPAIGGLIELWGFHQDVPPEGPPPSPSAVEALRAAHPRMTDLVFDGDRVGASNPAVQLDLGGFAKGAALDLAAAALRARGIGDAVLNAGGDVNVIGDHGDRPWRVAIRDPFAWGAVGSVALRPGEVLYTSGNYERYFETEGERFAHILDPRTGRPVQEVVSSSVLDVEGMRADAAATALGVAGADWPSVAAAMGIEAALVIDRTGAIFATPAMAARLEPARDGFPAPLQVVPPPPAPPRPECAAFEAEARPAL